MKRLVEKNINTSEEYNRIYFERAQRPVDAFDQERWTLLSSYFKGGRLVDLGCLDSLIPIIVKTKYPGSEIWCIDFAEEAVKDMEQQHNQLHNVFWHTADIYDTKFPKWYFSYAVLGEVLEHLEKPEEAIEEAMRILRHKGILALSVPLKEKYGEVDAERHLWSFSIEDIKELLNPYGSVKIALFPKYHIPLTAYHHKNILAWCTKK